MAEFYLGRFQCQLHRLLEDVTDTAPQPRGEVLEGFQGDVLLALFQPMKSGPGEPKFTGELVKGFIPALLLQEARQLNVVGLGHGGDSGTGGVPHVRNPLAISRMWNKLAGLGNGRKSTAGKERMESKVRGKMWALLVVGSIVGAFAVSLATRLAMQPAVTNDVTAYMLLNQGAESHRYPVLKGYADQAAQLASDPDLKKLADFLARYSDFCGSAHIETFEEADSFSGMMKSFWLGAVNQSKGWEGLGLAVEGWLLDPAALGKKVEEKYRPFFAQQQAAIDMSNSAFWMALIGFGVGGWWMLVNRTVPANRSTPNPIEVAAAVEPAAIVTCPSCGARNRSRGLRSGQKLVCGQCRAELSAVA